MDILRKILAKNSHFINVTHAILSHADESRVEQMINVSQEEVLSTEGLESRVSVKIGLINHENYRIRVVNGRYMRVKGLSLKVTLQYSLVFVEQNKQKPVIR